MKQLILLSIALLLLLFGCPGGGGGSSLCVDGTPPNSCSSNHPQYCTSEKVLIDEADICGCPAGETPAGSVCVPG